MTEDVKMKAEKERHKEILRVIHDIDEPDEPFTYCLNEFLLGWLCDIDSNFQQQFKAYYSDDDAYMFGVEAYRYAKQLHEQYPGWTVEEILMLKTLED